MIFRKIPPELPVALLINASLLALLLVFGGGNGRPPEPTPEIVLDIGELPPPPPPETPRPAFADSVGEGGGGDDSLAVAPEHTLTAANAIGDFTPEPVAVGAVMEKLAVERALELERIEAGIRVFDGARRLAAGLPEGAPAAGHQIGDSFRGRGDPGVRGRLLKRHGGGGTEDAVDKALKYLASTQNEYGGWGGSGSYESGDAVALSSLAMLAFFARGENFQSRLHAETIRRGCDFLLEVAGHSGIERAGKGFGHAILTYALAEGYAVSGSLSLRGALERRLQSVIARQNKFGSFAPDYDNSPQAPPNADQLDDPLFREIVVGEPACDLSLLGWHIQAMVAARNAGVEVAGLDEALARAAESLARVHQAAKGGFSQGINMRRLPANDNMNPVGLLGLQMLNAGGSAPARRALRLLRGAPPPKWEDGGGFPLYRWYYQTQAVFHAERGIGSRWGEWNKNLTARLLAAQRPDGGWDIPRGDNSYRLKSQADLSIYASSLCALMLQVYYRYLPDYSLAESAGFAAAVDEFDLGKAGLITRLPGGADPLAAVILGIGATEMEPVKFGKFDGRPADNRQALVEDEFPILATMRSTIQVKAVGEWPQTLQPNQRIALFLDDLIPRGFKGHLRLALGLVGSVEDANERNLSLEVTINGRRLHNSFLASGKKLVDLVIPADTLEPFGNICQIRNNGRAPLAFDAAELGGATSVGGRLYLLADKLDTLPPSLRVLFHTEAPKEAALLGPFFGGERQLLAAIDSYSPEDCHIAELSMGGSEGMGNSFHLHYLRQTGRWIVDWIAGGGAGTRLTSVMGGGQLYDSIFQTEYPALAAVRRVARLFEGAPRKLPAQLYPKYSDTPIMFGSAAAAYNAPGVATVVVARRFAVAVETEVLALVPWSGPTDMVVETGFLADNSPFAWMAPSIESESSKIVIENNIFRHSAVFPEMTVIRLARAGTPPLAPPSSASADKIPDIKFDVNSLRLSMPAAAAGMASRRIREARGGGAVYGLNGNLDWMPATAIPRGYGRFIPGEKESVLLSFQAGAAVPNRHDSVFLPLVDGGGEPRFLSFHVFPRVSGLKKGDSMVWAPFRMALDGRAFSTQLAIDRWQLVVLPLDGINPYWKKLRVLEPGRIPGRELRGVSYEINDVTIWSE